MAPTEADLAVQTKAATMQNKQSSHYAHTQCNKIYSALKLIENLYKQGLIDKHIFLNILNDHKDCVDISEFKHYAH